MGLAYESQRESAADTIRRRAIRHLSTGTEGALDSGLSDEDLDEAFDEDEFGDLEEGDFDEIGEDIG